MVQLFATFAFADQESLGFDTTIQPDIGNNGQFVLTVYPDNNKQNSRRFRVMQILDSYGAEPLRGRGTRVFYAVEIDGNRETNGSNVVIKDMWIDSDRMREGDILALLLKEADEGDKELVRRHFLTTICQGDVWTTQDTRDDTAHALMRGLDIASDHTPLFHLQCKPNVQNSEPPFGSNGLRATSRVQVPHNDSPKRYPHKTHYRVVFKEKGITIDCVKSLPDVMTVLGETVGGAFLFGTVHLWALTL